LLKGSVLFFVTGIGSSTDKNGNGVIDLNGFIIFGDKMKNEIKKIQLLHTVYDK
jgi:hypothetical protein